MFLWIVKNFNNKHKMCNKNFKNLSKIATNNKDQSEAAVY